MNESDIPDYDIDIVRFAAARKKEIDLLRDEAFLGKENKQKNLFQMLPRHMRRRTMGYLRKRLPHRIRQAAAIRPPQKASKRPSRKYRRRVRNLVGEYERRKRALDEKMWLETHIWHAKRFHMSNMYGYRLPLHDNCKGKRAVYNCLKKFCCLHDESYYVCYELEGEEKSLIEGLNQFCSTELGLTFAARVSLSGQCEGRVILYEPDKYPFNCLGPCRFIWKPSSSSTTRTIWLWIHPVIDKKVEAELLRIFELNMKQDDETVPTKRIKLDKSTSIDSDYIWTNQDKSIRMKSLKDKLVRFKLLGPMSTTLLANVLRPVTDFELEFDLKQEYRDQIEFWNQLSTSQGDLIQSGILSLLVKDPRLFLPKKKAFNQMRSQFLTNSMSNSTSTTALTKNLSHSSLWNQETLAKLLKVKKSTHEINTIRSNYLLPGTQLSQIENYCQIPVMLVRNNINNYSIADKNSSNVGWDLILPSGWAMGFWLNLVHLGARVIAQRELAYLVFESGSLSYPVEFGDTEFGEIESRDLSNKLYDKFTRRPPSKRVNYFKQGHLSPFYLPWRSLIAINSTNIDLNLTSCREIKYFVLRNRRVISKLQDKLFHKKARLELTEKEVELLSKSFVAVRLVSSGKGSLEQYSLLYAENKNEPKEKQRVVINKLIDEQKSQVVARLKSENKEKPATTINKLIRANFNKYSLLKDESFFLRYYLEIIQSENDNLPIGFISSNEYTLANGKCSANAFILTKYLVNGLDKRTGGIAPSIIFYQTPNCSSLLKSARIEHLFS